MALFVPMVKSSLWDAGRQKRVTSRCRKGLSDLSGFLSLAVPVVSTVSPQKSLLV